jgi:hypothetical protein
MRINIHQLWRKQKPFFVLVESGSATMPEPEAKKCIGCDGRAQFFFLVIVGTLGRSPKARANSQSIGVCDRCCNPNANAPTWAKLAKDVAVVLWMTRNGLLQKLETEPDSKTLAAGA